MQAFMGHQRRFYTGRGAQGPGDIITRTTNECLTGTSTYITASPHLGSTEQGDRREVRDIKAIARLA